MEREGLHPEDIFPLVVWQEIFNHLTHPDDLTNCYSATTTWRDLLQPKRTTFHSGIMSQVFSIIDANIGLSPDILACRRVCSSWKAAIDRFLQLHPRHTSIGFEKSPPHPILQMNPCLYPLPTLTFKTDDPLKLERLIQTTDLNPTLNPFFSRSVTFYESFILNDDGTTYRILTSRGQCFTRILDRFGTQIWHATFNFTDNVVDDVDVAGVELALYNSVRIFLQGLPNLRSLSIIISGNQRVDPHNMTENFKQLLKTCPLPPLNHLIFLNMKNVPNPLQTGLLNHYSTHLKTLSFQNNLWRPSFPPDANIIMKESRLEELKAFIYCSQDLLSLQGSGLPLKCLHLRWIQPSDLDMIVGTLATFSNTLRHLKIEFRGVKMHNFEKFTGILNLPHLETIKITALHSHLSNIDFLSGCPALKELEVDMWEPCTKTTNPHVIQFNEHVGLMQHSNIWGILRSLEKIRIGTVTKVNDGGFSNNLGQIWKENRYEYLRP